MAQERIVGPVISVEIRDPSGRVYRAREEVSEIGRAVWREGERIGEQVMNRALDDWIAGEKIAASPMVSTAIAPDPSKPA